jgi:MGT family glycosyltransferase
VTLGTVFNEALHLFSAILEGLREVDCNIIVTIGKSGDPAALGSLPPNVLIERYIPQSLLLPCCDLVISHGGSGTMLGAVNAGLPQLAIPQAADQFSNAAAIVRAGIGLSLEPPAFSSEAVRRGTSQLLNERGFVDRSRQVATEINAMPMPDEVVPVLERLIR